MNLTDDRSSLENSGTYMRHNGVYGDHTVGLYLTATFQNQMISIDPNNSNADKFQLKKLIRFAADYAIIPSIDESFGLVALESLALGTPVICSLIQGLSDVCTPYTNAEAYFDTLSFFMHKFTDDNESVDIRSLVDGDAIKSEKFKATEWEINKVMDLAFDLYRKKSINHSKIIKMIKQSSLGDWQRDSGSIEQFIDIYNCPKPNFKRNLSFEEQHIDNAAMMEKNYRGQDVSLKFIKHPDQSEQSQKCLFVVFNAYAPYGQQPVDDIKWSDIDKQSFPLDFFKKEKLDAVFVASHGNHWYQTKEMLKVFEIINKLKQEHGYRKVVTYGGSLGGFAALAFSEKLHATDVLAFCPIVDKTKWITFDGDRRIYQFPDLYNVQKDLSKQANIFCFYGNKCPPDKQAAETTLQGYFTEEEKQKLKLYPLPHDKHEIMMFLNQKKDVNGNRYLKNIARIINDEANHVVKFDEMFKDFGEKEKK